MLIARAPLRISLAGGGTDLPAYFERFGGMVVSTTIDKFVYAQVQRNGLHTAQISSADYHTFYRHLSGVPLTWDGELALPRAVLHEFGIDRGMSVFTASEVPPGTGLGSSSAVAVALIRAVAAHRRHSLSRQEIADLACQVELNKLGAPIGKQDQYAAAFGGLNLITFHHDQVEVERLAVPSDALSTLERRLMLFFTGTARNSATILRDQQRATLHDDLETLDRLHAIREAANTCRRYLETGDVDGIGDLLDQGWQRKKHLTTGITNERIDAAYTLARQCGAIGGKITGAGGGGFLLLYCPEMRQDSVTIALEGIGLRRMDFHFETQGVTLGSVDWAQAQDLEVEPDAAYARI